MKRFLLLTFSLLPTLLVAQTRTVVTSDSGVLAAPSNFKGTNFQVANTVFVDPVNGSDTTGQFGTINAYQTFGAGVSNLVNNSRLVFLPGTSTVTPRVVSSNYFGGINLFSKTNILIEGSPGASILDGSSTYGELLFISNCFGVTLRGISFMGHVKTNWTAAANDGGYVGDYLWAGISIYRCGSILFENNRVENHHDHGIWDLAGYQNYVDLSTNNIVVRNNYFYNIGSARTNLSIDIDGTAISPSGWTVEGNFITDCLRGIEPFDDNTGGYAFYNCFIRNNLIRNSIARGIFSAGSTNGQNVVVEGNYIYWDTGYTRRGSNVLVDAHGIELGGGGDGWTIRNNRFKHVPGNSISLASVQFVRNVKIYDNIFEYPTNWINGTISSAIGVGNGSGTTPSGQNCFIMRNFFDRCGVGIQIYSSGNAEITGNRFIDPIAGATACLYVQAFPFNSNLVASGNSFIDTKAAGVPGISITSGNINCMFVDNTFAGFTTKYANSSGDNATILGSPKTFSATIDFPSIGAPGQFTTNFTATGVKTNDAVLLSWPAQVYASGNVTNLVFQGWCSNDVIYIRAMNNDAVTAANPPSVTFRGIVRQVEAY